MREIADLMHLILPHAQACPEPTAVQHLRWAAMKFCEATRIWRSCTTFDVQGGCDEILCTPQHAQIFEIEQAWYNSIELEPKAAGDFDRQYDDSQPRWISQVNSNTVRLVPGAQETGALRLNLFLKPSRDAEDFPDFFDEFEQTLADGALSRILVLPNQPFTDPGMAGAFGASFQMELDRNFNRNLRGQQRAPMRTRARFL